MSRNDNLANLPDSDAPYALASVSERERRSADAILSLPHIQPLVQYVERIRAERGPECSVPCFDPCDGGVNARALFLLEAPGPKAVESGFISRNNPDPTARNVCQLMQGADLARKDTILWNIVPWYVGESDRSRIHAVRRQDIAEALPFTKELLHLLPRLAVIVLVGQKAQSAAATLALSKITQVPLVNAPHPSARVFNAWPHKQVEAEHAFRLARRYVEAMQE